MMPFPYSKEQPRSYLIPLFLIFFSIIIIISILTLTRLLTILVRPKPNTRGPRRPPPSATHPTHLLIVLGSGGHTAEMLNMLRRVPLLSAKFTHRTYVVSSGDGFSALKAREFEIEVLGRHPEFGGLGEDAQPIYSIVNVRRARRVHQSLLSAPWSASLCLWDCISVLKEPRSHQLELQSQTPSDVRKLGYPDLILTNGPGTGVCMVLASLILLFLGFGGPSSIDGHVSNSPAKGSQWQHSGQMRSVFIESWARVRTLSLSGKILLPLVDRFLVQWPGLEGSGGKAEYVGTLVA